MTCDAYFLFIPLMFHIGQMMEKYWKIVEFLMFRSKAVWNFWFGLISCFCFEHLNDEVWIECLMIFVFMLVYFDHVHILNQKPKDLGLSPKLPPAEPSKLLRTYVWYLMLCTSPELTCPRSHFPIYKNSSMNLQWPNLSSVI